MGNDLKYTPTRQAQERLERAYVGGGMGAEWAGVEKFAEGVFDLARNVQKINNHLNEVEDTNNATTMLSQLEIDTQRSIVDYETQGPNPDTYHADVSKMFGDMSREATKQYKFKTKDGQAAYQRGLENLRNTIEKNAIQREMQLRVQRGVAQWTENGDQILQGAAMLPNHEASQKQLEESLEQWEEFGVSKGLATREKAHDEALKRLNQNDWYFAEEQIEAHPEMMKDFLKDEEAVFEKYKYLAPNQLSKLRDMADQSLARKKNAEKEREEQTRRDWRIKDRKLQKAYAEAKDPESRRQAAKALEQHIWAGSEAGESPAYLDSRMEALKNPKQNLDPAAFANYIRGIKSGDYVDDQRWWDDVISGRLTIDQAKALDSNLESQKKSHGFISQWEKINNYADSQFEDQLKKDQFVATLEYLQRQANWADSDPRLLKAARQLLETEIEVAREGGFWSLLGDKDEKLSLYEALVRDKPWEDSDREWKHNAEYDPRIPSATPAEIASVDMNLKEYNKQRLAKGEKPYKNSGKVRQAILRAIRREAAAKAKAEAK